MIDHDRLILKYTNLHTKNSEGASMRRNLEECRVAL